MERVPVASHTLGTDSTAAVGEAAGRPRPEAGLVGVKGSANTAEMKGRMVAVSADTQVATGQGPTGRMTGQGSLVQMETHSPMELLQGYQRRRV